MIKLSSSSSSRHGQVIALLKSLVVKHQTLTRVFLCHAYSTTRTPQADMDNRSKFRAHDFSFGGALGDLHNRSWKARHLEVLEQQCGQDTGKWCRALSKLAREGKRVHMEAVLNRMVVLGRPVKGAFIRMFLDCCLASKNTVQAYEYLEKFSAHSPLHRDLYLHALKICGAVGDPSTASLLLELMRVRGVSPCSAAIRSHMTAFSTAGDVPRALSVLRSLRDHPPPHSSAMREASQQLPVPLPLQAADEVLRSAGVTLTDCNKMLQACVPAKDFPTALRIFKLVLAKGLVPCSYTWGAMVQVAAKTGQPERGLELLRTMLSDQQQRPPPSAHCFNHLLTAFSKVGNSGKFEEVLSLMMAAAVPLDEFSYSIMFSSVANGVLRGDSAVFTEHFRSVPPPTSRTPLGCSRDASPLPVTSEGEEALQSSATCMYEPPTEALVAHMLGRGLMLANHCWRVASAPYSKEGNHAGLKRLMTLVISFDPTERQGNSNRRGDGGGQSAKRTRKCTGGESAKNSASWKQLRFSMLRDCLGCLGKLGLADHAYALLRVSGNQRASPSEPLRDEQNCWLRVIRAYAEGQGDWRRALGVLDDMRAQGYEMTPLLWRYVLQQCAASEGAAELVALLRRCYQEDGILPDKEGWALLMAALDRPVSRVQDELASAAGGALLVTSDHSATTDFVYEANILKDFIKVCPVAVQQLIVASVVRHMTYVSRCPRWQITEFASACKGLRNVADRDLSSAVNKMLPSKMPDWSLHDTAPRTPLSSGSSDEVAALSSSQAPLTFLARMKSCALLNNVEGCLGVQKDLLMFLSKSKHSLHDIRQRGDDLVTCEYFEILLGMCVKSGRAQEARAAFRLLLDMRVRPSKTVCWQMLLRVYLPSNDLAGAISLAELCRQHSPLYSPFVDAIHAKVVRMIASQRGSRGQEAGEAAVTYIEGLLGSGATSSRLHAALVTELLKLGRVRPALASVERFLQLGEEEPSLLQESRYMDMAYMAVLDAIIKSVSISYSEKNRLIDQYIKSLVRGHVKTLPTYSLYTDYLIKDRNDIYVYIAMLHEMSLFFGQDSCSMWENLLNKCALWAMHEEAVWILDRMYECEAVHPSFECLGLVSKALSASGQFSEAWEMLQRMGLEFFAVHNDPSPTPAQPALLPSRYWHPLLNSLQEAGMPSLLLQVVDSMPEVHVAVDQDCRVFAMHACLASGQHGRALVEARHLCKAFELTKGGSSSPASKVLRPLLQHLAAEDLPVEVAAVIEMMNETGIPVDKDSWVCVQQMRRFDMVLESMERKRRSSRA